LKTVGLKGLAGSFSLRSVRVEHSSPRID